jgi:hypothetical protein
VEQAQLVDWLMQNGNPMVRWRVASELQDTPPAEQEALARDVLALPLVQETLEHLTVGDLAAHLQHLDPQALSRYAWIKERRTCYGWGWSPHLPGFQGVGALSDGQFTPLLARLELMARFARGRRSPWFQDALRHLEAYRTSQGTYRFPGHYLRESEGYYVLGYGMGLEENRRRPLGMEIESTFRMMAIRRAGRAEGSHF